MRIRVLSDLHREFEHVDLPKVASDQISQFRKPSFGCMLAKIQPGSIPTRAAILTNEVRRLGLSMKN